MKAFQYAPGYLNGFSLGFLIETNFLDRSTFYSSYEYVFLLKVYNIAKILIYILTISWVAQNLLIGYYNCLTAIEMSLAPTLISIVIAKNLLDNNFQTMLKKLLTFPLWTFLRDCNRIVYLYHPSIFWVSFKFWPISHFNLFHFSITLIVTYSISMFMHRLLEKPLNRIVNNLIDKIHI